MNGLTLSQFETISKLGIKMDGRRILITDENGNRAYYTIRLPRDDHDPLALVPSGRGADACADVSTNSYAYTHGGALYCAAVDAARELASVLGF